MSKEGKAIQAPDKPYYHYWQALYHSFYNYRVYVDVGKHWKGLGIVYLLLLSLVVTLPFSLRIISDFNQFFNNQLIDPLQQLPPLYIQNGQVVLNKPMPYLIKNKQGRVAAIVDTTGKVNKIDNTFFPYLNILVTKDKLHYRFPNPEFFFDTAPTPSTGNSVYIYPLSKSSNAVFVGKEWIGESGINRLKYFFAALIYPTIVLLCFVFCLVLFFAFALLGQLIARYILKFSLTFKQAFRLLGVSATPFMMLLWLSLTFNWLLPSFGLPLLVIFAFYFCFAVLSLKRESQKLVLG